MANDGFAAPSAAETLFIERVRAGRTQREAAKKLKVSLGAYSMMELAKVPAKRVTIGRLAAHERCLLQRRRAGYSQVRVAKELGYCRWWVNQMEHGKIDASPLIEYWDV